MFTINIYLKLAIIAVCLIGGVVLSFIVSFWYALPFILIGLGFLVSYILLGTVQSAAQLVEKMDFVGAENRLALTWKPNWLYVTNRAFYYIIKGSLAMNLKDMDLAEAWFQKANGLKLPSDTEKAMVLLQLANINANKGKWNHAKVQYMQLKKLKVSDPNLKQQIKQFDKAFTNRGQMRHAQSAGMRGSRKRGRPRMR